jgi:LacI family transcriptional regulator
MMAVTIKDIARNTNLSIATISKYINGIKVSDENSKIIKKSISEFGYSVNCIARGLKTNRTKTIGVIVPDLTDIYCSTIIKQFEKNISKDGYSLLVCDCQSSSKIMVERIELLVSKMVDGILLFPILDDKKAFEAVKHISRPMITVDQKVENVTADFVAADGFQASYLVGKYFLEKKHISPAVITGPDFNYTSLQRLNGFKKAYDEAGITINEQHIMFTDYTAQGGYDALMQLWRNENKPTAIFTTNYHTTTGVIMAASDLSLQFPKNFSLFAFDNFELARVVRPSLSVVIQPMEKLGDELAKLFLKRLNGSLDDYPNEIILNSELSIGESVAENIQ